MPKTFSAQERENIRRILLKEASSLLFHKSVKEITVDELAEAAGIAKGSFYLFYKSKEALFLDFMEDFFLSEEEKYLDMLSVLDENHIVTSLSKVLLSMLMDSYKSGMYRFFDEKEMNYVLRKAEEGKAKIRENAWKDYCHRILGYFMIEDDESLEKFDSAFYSLFFILLHENQIEEIEKALAVLVRGLTLALVE